MRTPTALTALVLLVSAGLDAQAPDYEAAFLVRLGTDTLALERVARTGHVLTGVFVIRSPRTQAQQYRVETDGDGRVTRFELARFRGGETSGTPATRFVITFTGDSAIQLITRGDSSAEQRIAAPAGTVPVMLNAYGLLELVTRRAAPITGPVEVPALFPGSAEAGTVSLAPGPGDSTVVRVGGIGPLRMALDRQGTIRGVNGIGGDINVTAERLRGLDVAGLARAFAARDRAGRGLGTLSPTDTVSATVAGATVTVRYGRPSMRGRQIFGGVVPFDRVWRTGANQATHITTGADLMIGGTHVPAGTYTLYTIPSQSGWTLIINRQTGQGGTTYDQAMDLARIPMRVDSLAEPVEQFTIAVEPTGQGGRLALSWERTRAWVALRDRP